MLLVELDDVSPIDRCFLDDSGLNEGLRRDFFEGDSPGPSSGVEDVGILNRPLLRAAAEDVGEIAAAKVPVAAVC